MSRINNLEKLEDGTYCEAESRVVICPKCNKRYKQIITDQEPGFREIEEDICPYCGGINGHSRSEEFHNEKMRQKGDVN